MTSSLPAFSPTLAEIRFGCGLAPRDTDRQPAAEAGVLLDRLRGPDLMARDIPIETWSLYRTRLLLLQQQQKAKRRAGTEGLRALADGEVGALKVQARRDMKDWMARSFLRRAVTADGFRERLVAFWADHFTAAGKQGLMKRAVSPYVEEAIRPHVAGRFADLLKAVVRQPVMLDYLDQSQSIGPGAPELKRRDGRGGMNENLARELLELTRWAWTGPMARRTCASWPSC